MGRGRIRAAGRGMNEDLMWGNSNKVLFHGHTEVFFFIVTHCMNVSGVIR